MRARTRTGGCASAGRSAAPGRPSCRGSPISARIAPGPRRWRRRSGDGAAPRRGRCCWGSACWSCSASARCSGRTGGRHAFAAVVGPHWPAGFGSAAARQWLRMRRSAQAGPPRRDLWAAARPVAEYPSLVDHPAGRRAAAARAAAGVLGGAARWRPALLATPVFWCCFAAGPSAGWTPGGIETLFRAVPRRAGMVTRPFRVGIPVSEAIRASPARSAEGDGGGIRRIADRLSIGLPIDQALAETAHRNGVPEYRFFATASPCKARPAAAWARRWRTWPRSSASASR